MEELLKDIPVGSALQLVIVSFVLGLCAIVAGLILRFRLKSGDLRRIQKLVEARAVPIARAQPPVAKVEGAVCASPAGTLRSPLSGRECVIYTIEVRNHFRSTDGQYESPLIHEERDTREFHLQDATGRARVIAGTPVLMTSPDTLAQSGVPTPAAQASLPGWAHQRGVTLSDRTSVTERRIEVGQHVMVHGHTSRQHSPTGPEVVLTGTARDPLVIATAHEGQVRVRGWMAHLDRVVIGIGCLMTLAPVLLVAAFVAYVLAMR